MEFEPFGNKPNVIFEVTIKWNGKEEKIWLEKKDISTIKNIPVESTSY